MDIMPGYIMRRDVGPGGSFFSWTAGTPAPRLARLARGAPPPHAARARLHLIGGDPGTPPGAPRGRIGRLDARRVLARQPLVPSARQGDGPRLSPGEARQPLVPNARQGDGPGLSPGEARPLGYSLY